MLTQYTRRNYEKQEGKGEIESANRQIGKSAKHSYRNQK